ncbi:MAG: peptidoglycan DD-metalloendopeptidase family protein [Deltaproteobacteria bacterium]|jgi:murein DD-endopeptidase MepM/ murein hydrolase activator NlpD|nr:peptidoglycan DD-metalloendopeptidase family protein [Deltaproteobacteria bacterium]
MKKKITFFILGNTGSIIKRTTVSRGVITCLTISIAVCLILFSIVIYDYLNKQEKIVNQQEEIVNQRKQLKAFAADINSLKSKLVDLKDFEKKIRNVADIEEDADQENLFGVGGSIPEDFDTQIPITEEYNSLIREMHEQTQQFNLAAINQKKSFESLFNNLEDQRNLLAATPAIRPTDGWISSTFGYRTSPFTGLREFHNGLDIATQKGTPILAAADGVVTFAGTKGLMGKLIVIDHGYGMVTRYAHIHKMLKKRGDAVKKGDTIALVGNTGRSTGSHLHYEVHLDGIPVNPAKYILN